MRAEYGHADDRVTRAEMLGKLHAKDTEIATLQDALATERAGREQLREALAYYAVAQHHYQEEPGVEPLYLLSPMIARAARAAAPPPPAAPDARDIAIARLEMALTLELNSLPALIERAYDDDTMRAQLERNKEGLERVLASVDAPPDRPADAREGVRA